MAKNTIYAYLMGNDFSNIADHIVAQINQLIGYREWICPDIWAVNQQSNAEDGSIEWELGINLDLPDPYQEPPNWFEDVKVLISFCVDIRKKYNQDFIVGISDNKNGIVENIVKINTDEPDIEYVKRVIGVEPPKEKGTEHSPGANDV